MKIKGLMFISNFNVTKDGKAAILNVSAFDKDAGGWVDGKVFVPIKGFLESPEKEKAYCAIAKDKESGKRNCHIKVLNEYIYQGMAEEEEKKTKKDELIPF